MKKKLIVSTLLILMTYLSFFVSIQAEEKETEDTIINVGFLTTFETKLENRHIPDPLPRFVWSSGLKFEYPDYVRGIYLTGHSAGNSRFEELVSYIHETELNAMVIDIKDDWGNITYKVDEDSPFYDVSRNYIKDVEGMLKRLEEEQIYPIARIVVFKDTELAKIHPEWSFLENGKVWKNRRGEAFVNPFLEEVWKYNVDIAIEAAKLGFQEIQFDYVRFPEGFETKDKDFEYSLGKYSDNEDDDVKRRVDAVTDFVAYAKKELEPYGVDVSVDIFGYSATIEEAPGIGQNFSRISENVDVISSMIYPSHWGNHYFGIPVPDKEPYRLVDEYAKVENEVLSKLENKPVSRPWLQDFSATWLYPKGQVFYYGKDEVEAQIKALYDNGIYEYLLWDPSNRYTRGVNYDPRD